ncbi:MAG TPA: hypothetical protein VM369_12340, partial [Candidatus Binatia bacterium]|nr:hypothetical protein [Candidatus Binatia bacterium]
HSSTRAQPRTLSMNPTTNFSDKAANGGEAIRSGGETVRSAVRDFAEGAENAATGVLLGRLEAMGRSAQALGGSLVRQARAGAAATDAQVHTHAWKAVCIAAAAGLALGFVAARRR